MGETINQCLHLVSLLQQKGISAEVYGENKSFKSKLKEANKRGVPFVAIIGENEVKEGKITLKDMASSSQQSVTKEELINLLR